MWKKLFSFAETSRETPRENTGHNQAQECPAPAAVEESRPPSELGLSSFEDIYRGAPVRSSRVAYTILKVAEMMHSPHLESLSPDARRCSLMMALDAAGVEVEDLLQDAMVRQRALNDYEDAQQEKLKTFETVKIEENRKIQAELDRITAQHMNRIQGNLDQVARQQDLFRAWQKQKDQEARRISDAASVCVPQNSAVPSDGLSMLLERVTAPKR